MPPVRVKIIQWPTLILRVVLSSLIHPSGILVSKLFDGKPLDWAYVAIVFLPLFAFYIIIQIVPILWSLLRGDTREILADSSGLKIKAFRKSRSIPWTHIATMEKAQVPFGKSLHDVLTLRDGSGSVQIQFKRNLQEASKLKEQYDWLETVIAQHVGTKGLISTVPLESTPTQTSFVLTTWFKILGLGSLFLWLPFAYFSWSARTGGPLVGAGFLGFAVLGVAVALLDKRYEVDERGVRYSWLFKREELNWEEIQRIGLTLNNTSLIFASDQRTISLLGPTNWKEGSALMQFLQSKIRRYNIEWQPNASAKWLKNCGRTDRQS